jgi:uncharacterized membrane protein YkvA (DUF1232 family)
MKNPFARWTHRGKAGPEPPPASSPSKEPLQATVIRPEDYVGSDEARNEQVVRSGFVAKAKRYLRHIPMASEVVAMYFCMLDPRTPFWVKGTAAAALAYFILPLDAIPDVLPLVGMSDDVTVLTAALTALSAHITAEHRRQAAEWLAHERLITA